MGRVGTKPRLSGLARVPFDHARIFPRLEAEGFAYTSPESTDYNCVAWAAEDDSRRWDPWSDDYYWPEAAPRSSGIDAMVAVFESLGYSLCADGDYEVGMDKVALYADPLGEATHAARQIGPNAWTSKIGDHDDITHTLGGLVSDEYGSVSRFLKRSRQS